MYLPGKSAKPKAKSSDHLTRVKHYSELRNLDVDALSQLNKGGLDNALRQCVEFAEKRPQLNL